MAKKSVNRSLAIGFLLLGMGLPIAVLWQSDSIASPIAGELGLLNKTWGSQGGEPGLFQKPRAMTIDDLDRLYIVDKAARIQVFDREGKFSHGWKTPKRQFGKPTGLSFDNEGNLMVADTHYYRILFYTPQGKLLTEKTIGGNEGQGPGEFGWVTDCVQDSKGNFYISEYGELDRIHKFSPDRKFLWSWGGHGSGDDEFMRPANLAIDEEDHLWVVDATNNRVMQFDVSGDRQKLLQNWGKEGGKPGQLKYPYDIVLDGDFVYICEFGNSRIQKFLRDGTYVSHWGVQGRDEGELYNPWAIVKDSRNHLHVLDTYNQRVHRIRLQ